MTYGSTTLQLWRPRGDFGLSGGVGPNGGHGMLFFGSHPNLRRDVALRFGFSAVAQVGRFVYDGGSAEGGPTNTSFWGGSWRAGLEVGLHRRNPRR